MRAEELDEQFPIVDVDSDALEAARMIAEHHLPGLIVIDSSRKPYAVLLASEVLHLILPRYVQDNMMLAGVMGDALADHAQNLAGKTVGDVLPKQPKKIPSVDARDGVIKVAAEMAQLRTPLIAVVQNGALHGVITASRLLAGALKS
ncbi:CBS domain-containing protein [Candidatus Mycobacterium wuenschmannii]|uniref:CBS domain-containing protein n=1 Tax=Candidatus Mycobacterium wuenschmannii TaxID=3027808 RepID=A0ABY8W0G0_9MYCO|nr:CBS domain-containing protein [Candidatus Mycobacterium wuenschmannii]WIM88452.1 CBS domain-containing protein [Candidatus Mycobacterium wuenschmannii]